MLLIVSKTLLPLKYNLTRTEKSACGIGFNKIDSFLVLYAPMNNESPVCRTNGIESYLVALGEPTICCIFTNGIPLLIFKLLLYSQLVSANGDKRLTSNHAKLSILYLV